ncbi:MAG: hypothetical protein QOF15_2738 [Mycobacterium sp.]|nr:hypothetical protein [Mycobacterium sp.]
MNKSRNSLPDIDTGKGYTVSARLNSTVPSANYAQRTVVTSDGVRLAVRDYGASGDSLHTVVLLHGLCLTQESWALQVRLLTRRWGNAVRIISYDHRGHGGSAGAAMHTYRVERLAADLGDILKALRVTGPLTLVGHSLGGMTALAYLSRPELDRPVQVAGLVLIATAAGRLSERGLGRVLATPATRVLFDLVGRMPRRTTDQTIKGVTRPVGAALARCAGPERLAGHGFVAVAAELIRAASPATAAGFLLDLKDYDVSGSLASIRAKTIVISGANDMTTPDAHARDLVAAIPGAMHLQLPAAGHMLLLDAPHSVSTAINRAMGLHRRPGWTAKAWATRHGLPSSAIPVAS